MTQTIPDKVRLLLEMMASAKGEIDATETPNSLLNYFCDDGEFGNTDTFNKAIELGFVQSSHCTMFETSKAWLTEQGKVAAADAASH